MELIELERGDVFGVTSNSRIAPAVHQAPEGVLRSDRRDLHHGNGFENHFLEVFNGPIMGHCHQKIAAGGPSGSAHCTSRKIPIARANRGS